MTLNCCKVKFSWNFATFLVFRRQSQLNEWRQTHIVSDGIVAHYMYISAMYSLDCVDIATRSSAMGRETKLRWQKQVFIHTRVSRAYLALARLSCYFYYLCKCHTISGQMSTHRRARLRAPVCTCRNQSIPSRCWSQRQRRPAPAEW